MTEPKLDSTLIGVAGEYATAAELTLRNYIAAISLRNSRGTDIIATSIDGLRSFSIQVKTTNEGKPHWMLNEKSERLTAGSHFYVFVKLNGSNNRPDFYIVPSAVVADRISTSHKAWLAEPKRDGAARKDTSMRKFTDEQGEFLECWNVLKATLDGQIAG